MRPFRMVQVNFIEHEGRSYAVEAENGQTLMQAATSNGVRGIVAECGGARVCGTCHCYIDEPWFAVSGGPCEDEKMLLEFSEHHQPSSRLSCQIPISDAMDGMRVRLPPSQP